MLIHGIQVNGCLRSELNALLIFKASLIDQHNRLSSWSENSKDCCQWEGVHCNSNNTGHVIRLDLSGLYLQGNLTQSLLNLTHLQYLDLSNNCFNNNPIPKFIGSLNHLVYLNLSFSCSTGVIPHELSNLSRVEFLDLSEHNETMVDDAAWLSHLSSLRYLTMNGVTFTGVTNIMQSLNNLPHLEEVYLRQCSIESLPQSIPDLNFTSLTIMDIGENNLHNTSIPDWLFRIPNLVVLQMDSSGFTGTIPSSVGNATKLELLDLYWNMQMSGDIPRELGNLCKMQQLYVGAYTFSGQRLVDFEDAFSGCIKNSLSVLSFFLGWMIGILPDWLGDLRNLTNLVLSGNQFSGSIPESLGRLSRLKFLDLSNNDLSGTIPVSIGRLSRLQFLDLSNNDLNGIIPVSIGRLSSLQTLILEHNQLNGVIPESLGQLSKLETLDLFGNNFNFSIITEAHFANLTSLKDLTLWETYLVLNISSNWLPGFKAKSIDLTSCKVGPKFPAWLENQVNLSTLMMSSAGIKDSMPDWFWNITYTMTLLDLTYNEITGILPTHLKFQPQLQSVTLLLGFNLFEGSVPNFPANLAALDLTDNSLSGTIPSNLGDMMNSSQLSLLSFSSNNLEGGIPNSLCNFINLAILDLSKNHLTGEIPDCWNNSQILGYLNLANNMLEGGLPVSIGSLRPLRVLDLNNNSLHGEFPSFLKNCTSLITIDLGHNKFTGKIPTWVNQVMISLMILNLGSNDFSGDLPLLSNLTLLHFLDLSHNSFTGTLPKSYGNFSNMVNVTENDGASFFKFNQGRMLYIHLKVSVQTKGGNFLFGNLLSFLRLMDLSANHLSGQIPEEIPHLLALQSLDLSGNHLTGQIPADIGLMHSLESLDLSRNDLTGPIPTSLSTLDSLGHLNLSYNNLSGDIPFVDHLTTFNDPSIYVGNLNLCGSPLKINCTSNVVNRNEDEEEDEGGDDGMLWIYIGLVSGFLVGFWTVFGIILFNKMWRYAYFRFVDYLFDKVYVMVAVAISKFRRNLVKMKFRLMGALLATNN
ncbi:Non-specific serine/threonine protein kinase protein [Dioscorea alata]|uniref:Non-specific serine/threonine protein kinase protein n=1 Tax=Dioscorea alata TaxID=55571 RepID=A0ACB7V391_DIOAL|nr:Non-specific serine/threonine protein kinase protein [Dioscorea alata]